jgi:NOL1/NOP2/fmu family ribosome biogenesis protein
VVPVTIQKYVSQHYPDAKVVKIEVTDRKGYEVDLSNGFDIEFDKKMNVIEIDR